MYRILAILCAVFSTSGIALGTLSDAASLGIVPTTSIYSGNKGLSAMAESSLYPVAIFCTDESKYYLIADLPVNLEEFRLYFRDGDETFFYNCDGLFSEKVSSTLFFYGPDLTVREIYMERIEQPLRDFLLRCTAFEKNFIEPTVGSTVTILGRSISSNVPGIHHKGVVASQNNTCYEVDLAAPLPYSTIQPASGECPILSWVISDPSKETKSEDIAGLLIHHMPFVNEDRFLDINSLRMMVDESSKSIDTLLSRRSQNGIGRCVYVSVSKSKESHNDPWVPTGSHSLSDLVSHWDAKKSSQIERYSGPFIVPGSLVKNESKCYLILNAYDSDSVTLDSSLYLSNKGETSVHRIGDLFDLNVSSAKDIFGVFVALPLKDLAEYSDLIAKQVFDLVDQELPAYEDSVIYGFSITSSTVFPSIEPSLVFYSAQSDSVDTQDGRLYFDSRIYPAALFVKEYQRFRFLGMLGHNRLTQESTIITTDELRLILNN